jgi:predicted nucleic-acid-binding protein
MRIADTNVLLALVVDDRPRHAALIEAAIDPDKAPVLITEAVLVETASVLCWSYRFRRSGAAEALLDALNAPGVIA